MNDHLRRIVADALKVTPQAINDETSPATNGSWDSHATVELILALEQKYGLTFSVDELAEITNVGAIHKLLSSRGVEP